MLEHSTMTTIRAITAADIDGLLALYAQLKPFRLDQPTDLSRDRVDSLLMHPGFTIFGAFDSDRILASCVLHVLPSLTGTTASYAMIENLMTQPGEHNKGHRRRLIQAAGAAAIEAGCERIMLMSGRSQRSALLRELRLNAIRGESQHDRGSLTFRPR